MKSYQSKLASPMLLSPKLNFKKNPLSEILSSLSHHRCYSVKNSPYQNQFRVERLKKVHQCPSRYHSPKFSYTQKNRSSNIYKEKSKPPAKKAHKKKKSNFIKKRKVDKLVQITDKEFMVAPKIYENQIFTDIYDPNGNHDRIVEISEQTKDQISEDEFIVDGKLMIPEDISSLNGKESDRTRVRPPDNSCLEDTKAPNDIHMDLWQKINELAISQKKHLQKG